MINWWTKIERGLVWLLLIILPWQMRIVLLPVFDRGVFMEYSAVTLYLTDVLILVLLINWALTVVINRQKIILGSKLIFWLVVSLIVWVWLSLFLTNLSGILGSPLAGIWVAGKLTLFGLFYFYLINRVKSLREIIVPLSIGVLLQGGVAIGQYFLNHSLGLKLLDESVLSPLDKGIPVVIKDGVRQLRAHGLLPHANVLGGYLAISLILMTSPPTWKKNNYWFWIVFLVGMAGLFLSFSRSAWLVFLVGATVIGWYGLHYKFVRLSQLLIKWLVGLMVIGALVVSQYQAVLPRITTNQPIEKNSLTEREQQWAEFKTVYAKSRVTGVGISQYLANIIKLRDANAGWIYQDALGGWIYQAKTNSDYPQPVHNVFLLVLAELGIIGLIIFCAVLAAGLWELWRTKSSPTKIILGVTWVGLIVLGLLDHYLWDLQQGKLLFWLVLALIGVTGYNERYGTRGERNQPS